MDHYRNKSHQTLYSVIISGDQYGGPDHKHSHIVFCRYNSAVADT